MLVRTVCETHPDTTLLKLDFLITLRLENDDIKPFLQYAVDNWKEEDQVKAEEVVFSELELILTIDESTRRLTQIEKKERLCYLL
ncbi:V-type sodium pump subunit F (Na(+)-translocating ATPase subunit F) [Desmospora sp. 8437]|nr:V-type sodium pump subunit F (Na(+)-translocating ATPase subunit F) [Desmospora sp. 8437]